MGIFDTLKKSVESSIKKEAAKLLNETVQSLGKEKNISESFSFAKIPETVEELRRLPEAVLDSPYKTTALTMVALYCYEQDPEEAFRMLVFLKGPDQVSTYEKQFIQERLKGKEYKARSFFSGATPENGYHPEVPYRITVEATPYSFDNENWATLYVSSSGSDNPRPIKLRKKPSTGQWFLNDIQCLADVRVPVEEDPWA